MSTIEHGRHAAGVSAATGRTCPSCARDVRPGTRFCTGCGSHLPGADTGPATPAAPTVEVHSLDAPTVSTSAATRPAVPAPRAPLRPTARATPPSGPTLRASAPTAPPPGGPNPRAALPTARAVPAAWPVEPAPSGGSGRGVRLPVAMVLFGAVAVAALILLVGLVAFSRVTPSPATVPESSPATVGASSSGTDGTTGTAATDGIQGGDVVGAPGGDPLTTLRTIAGGDTGAVDGLTGSWVPQISAKKPGLVADGQTYDAAAVLADHQRLRAQYPDVRLLWSADYSTYRSADFWVTVVARPFPDATSANSWCDAQGFAPTECYAKLISHTAGPDGGTRLRAGS